MSDPDDGLVRIGEDEPHEFQSHRDSRWCSSVVGAKDLHCGRLEIDPIHRAVDAPPWAHALLTALLTGEPLNFGQDHPPTDIQERLDQAAAGGTLRGEPTMLAAVRRDLEAIKTSDVPGGYTYAAIAIYLAGVIDKRGADDGPSVTAKLADQLGKAMAALTRKGGGDDGGFTEWSNGISQPVRE